MYPRLSLNTFIGETHRRRDVGELRSLYVFLLTRWLQLTSAHSISDERSDVPRSQVHSQRGNKITREPIRAGQGQITRLRGGT